MTPARGSTEQAVRIARAVVLASTTLAFAAAAHTSAGGRIPSGLGLLALGALALMVTTVVGRRALNPLTLAPVLALLQGGLHLGFMTLAGHSEAAGRGAPSLGAHAGHGAAAGELVAGLAAAAETGIHSGAHTHPAMLAAHVGAVLVTTVLAVGADRALARIAARLSGLVQILAGTPVVSRCGGMLAPRDDAAPGRPFDLALLLVRRPRRGPPVVVRTA